jgi:dCMP deaminase
VGIGCKICDWKKELNDWDIKYLNLAKQISTWSKDPSTKVGSVCIGKKGQILSQGYNGFPRGIEDTEERLNTRETKYKYVVHSEMNCIFNACLTGISLQGATLYLYGLPPCAECAKGIVQVGIKHVCSQYPDPDDERWAESCQLADSIFHEAGVSQTVYNFEFDGIK